MLTTRSSKVAAYYGRKDMVQFLINQKADVNMGEIKLRYVDNIPCDCARIADT